MRSSAEERVKLPEDLVQALRHAVASFGNNDPEVYLALERDKTVMMAGLRDGELYLLEASGLVSKADFIVHAKHIPLSALTTNQRRTIMLGYAVWALEQAAEHGLKEPLIA